MTSATPSRRRRWLQFSLRSVLVITALIAVALGWGNQLARRYDARQRIEQLPIKIEVEAGPAWITDRFGAGIGKYFDQLVSIDFTGCDDLSGPIDLDGLLLPNLNRQSALRKLNLGRLCEVDDRYLAAIGGLDQLEELILDETNVTDDGLRHLSGLRQLKTLSLFAANRVSDSGLEHLKALDRLEVLDLSEAEASDGCGEALAQLRTLRRLNLAHTAVGDAVLQHLQHLTRLKYLNLSGTKVTSQGLKHLAQLLELKELYLAGTSVDDAGLDHLRQLPLRLLSLANTAVTGQRRTDLIGLSPERSLESPTLP
jgi:hypothetical protein